MNILVTGASGFVGTAIVEHARRRRGRRVVAASRRAVSFPEDVVTAEAPDLDGESDWSGILNGVDVVVHAAARVHVMREHPEASSTLYRAVNVDGTVRLARQAAARGVGRFVFLSSIKVNGEQTRPGRPFRPDDDPAPVDPYGVSKRDAELALLDLARTTGMEVVIIRPVLVYGPGARANFLSMMRWLDRRLPLPLGSIKHNRRSLVYVENLADLIVRCAEHPSAANQIFLASDDESLSTRELLMRLGAAMERRAVLFPVPEDVLAWAGRLLGASGAVSRLCGSLEVDIGKTRQLLDWQPPISVDRAFAHTAAYFRRQRS